MDISDDQFDSAYRGLAALAPRVFACYRDQEQIVVSASGSVDDGLAAAVAEIMGGTPYEVRSEEPEASVFYGGV